MSRRSNLGHPRPCKKYPIASNDTGGRARRKPPGNGGYQHADKSSHSRWTSSPLAVAIRASAGRVNGQLTSSRLAPINGMGQSKGKSPSPRPGASGQARRSQPRLQQRMRPDPVPPEADADATITGTPPRGNAQRAAKSHQQQLIRQTKGGSPYGNRRPAGDFANSGKSENASIPPPASWRHRSPTRPPVVGQRRSNIHRPGDGPSDTADGSPAGWLQPRLTAAASAWSNWPNCERRLDAPWAMAHLIQMNVPAWGNRCVIGISPCSLGIDLRRPPPNLPAFCPHCRRPYAHVRPLAEKSSIPTSKAQAHVTCSDDDSAGRYSSSVFGQRHRPQGNAVRARHPHLRRRPVSL